jgi:intein-encoded DNA endonuclease-like protein
MAKAFCIPKNIAEQLKESVRNGEWNMQTLWDMTSKQRHELFMKYVDDATALRMNAGFEQAMISEQQNALVKWAEKVFVGQDEKTKSSKKGVVDKIKELNEVGYLKATINKDGEVEADDATKIFLSDLVEEKLGASISEEEMKTITEKTKILEQYEKDRDEFGLPQTITLKLEETWITIYYP